MSPLPKYLHFAPLQSTSLCGPIQYHRVPTMPDCYCTCATRPNLSYGWSQNDFGQLEVAMIRTSQWNDRLEWHKSIVGVGCGWYFFVQRTAQ